MTVIDKSEKVLPWYKEFYVWFIILFPVLAILAGIATTILAVQSDDGLVVDDYYKQGLEINRKLGRDQSAIGYGLNAEIEIDAKQENVSIKLKADSRFNYPDNFSATFLHSTRAGLDKEANMALVQDNTYQGKLGLLARGKWYVHLQRDDWRLIKTIYID